MRGGLFHADCKKFNQISDIIYTQMPQDHYRFIEEGEDYDVALVRSAQLGEMSFPKQLLAIARAGAGVDNIPVDRCSEEGIVVFNTPAQRQCGQGTGVVWYDTGLPPDCSGNSMDPAAARGRNCRCG